VCIPKERKAMKNKPILLTLILTMLFSFAVTSVVWAECTVTIVPPEAIIMYGETLTFVATTEGEGCNPPNYTWEVSEGTCTGGSIDPDTGTYTAGYYDNSCADTIMVTDTANGGIVATATVIVGACLPVVSISGPADPCPVSATYTAETIYCDGVPLSGTYTWELDGEHAGTGDSFEITCTEEGTKILLVTDTVNGNITASTTITCDCSIYSDCFVDMSQNRYLKSNWIPLPALIEIGGGDISRSERLTYECESSGPIPSIIPLLKFIVPKDYYPIKQLVIVMPSILTGNFGEESEWCDVRIEDCAPGAPRFELDILNFGPFPLRE